MRSERRNWVSAAGDSYDLLLRHKLPGGTSEGEEIPLGANHLAAMSSEPRGFVEGEVTEVNFSDEEDLVYLGVYVSSHPQASSPMLAVATEGRYWMLGGGDADGNRLTSVADILKWDVRVGFPDADDRGEARFSELGNYDGIDKIDGYDCNVWKRMVNEGITYAPVP